ncbi:NmrA family NAD(P)-binding protein [Novosphingobium sp. ZW T3_23]|uniref:NmrA family NAD(P)-binding protein n=1 Tax=Novosphingobium sp. ZW T3_23 TaxID=3378084 RepID=UPI003852F071
MVPRVLVLGATGNVGSQVVRELDANSEGLLVRLSTSKQVTAEKWRSEGRDAVVLDLDDAATFASALAGVDRIFLLTGYTADMLFQSKRLVDAALDADVTHIVHLGVFTSRRDLQPHFAWHDLIEAYVAASGIAWTNLHPNVITDTMLARTPSVRETGSFMGYPGDVSVGWACTADIAAVAATVLREGPERHGGKDYYLSVEVLRGTEVAAILSKELGKEISYQPLDPAAQKAFGSSISDTGARYYMESATITMELADAGKLEYQAVVRDDVQTVVGRPGTTMAEWVRKNLT